MAISCIAMTASERKPPMTKSALSRVMTRSMALEASGTDWTSLVSARISSICIFLPPTLIPPALLISSRAISAPAGTPRDILAKLAAEIQKAVQAADLKDRYLTLGMDTAANTPDEMTAMMRREQERYGQIVKAANIRIEN